MLISLTSNFRSAVFASSLLSLISPWAHSPVARYPLSRRCPRPVAPPPPPRRHSDPTRTNITDTNKTRRHSDIKNPQSKLDLRQELENLNLNRQEFLGWLGDEFDETDEFVYDDEQFRHDIPLQRSVSLDRGIDIINYLQKIGSDWSGSEVGSSWTVHSDEHETMFEQYSSLEDIPASPSKVKSRRVSDMDAIGRNLALTALRDSYKGVDMDRSGGSISPQIKKLQRSFTFPDKLEDFMEAVKRSTENLNEAVDSSRVDSPCSSKTSEGSRSGLDRMIMLHRSLSCRNSAYDCGVNKHGSDDDDLEIRIPYYRSISMDPKRGGKETDSTKNMRQRRLGVIELTRGNKKEVNLRKDVLNKKKLSDVKSCENLSVKRISRRGSLTLGSPAIDKSSYVVDFTNTGNTDLRKIKRTSPSIVGRQQLLPTIVVTDHSDNDVANNENVAANTSKLVETVEINRCLCRICTDEVGVDRSCFARKLLGKLLVKMVSCKEYGRKLTYWDENNNLNNDEMYKCLIHVLKLMFGLWLRHLDHTND